MSQNIIIRTKKNEFIFQKIENHLNFEIGSDILDIEYLIKKGEKKKYLLRETPKQKIKLSAFYIQDLLVSISQYKEFLDSTNYISTVDLKGSGSVWNGGEWLNVKNASWDCNLTELLSNKQDLFPVNRIFYEDAKYFCEWLNQYLSNVLKRQGFKVRLPTEAEWELTASVNQNDSRYTKKKYSWKKITYALEYIQNLKDLPLVNQCPIEINGTRGLCGINWQWCEDFYENNFYQQKLSSNPMNKKISSYHSLRGGNFLFPKRGWRTTYRSCPSGDYSSFSFRVVIAKKITF